MVEVDSLLNLKKNQMMAAVQLAQVVANIKKVSMFVIETFFI